VTRTKLIAILLLGVGGCSTLPYNEPTDGTRTRARFVSSAGDDTAFVRTYDDPGCQSNEQHMMSLRAGYFVNASPRRLGLPLWEFHENAAKEVYVQTTRPIHFMVAHTVADTEKTNPLVSYTQRCGVAFTYKFDQGRDYELMFNRDSAERCSISINELVVRDGAPQRVRLAKFENRLTAETQSCMEALRKRRL
jgi:hypothetical protein